MPRAPTTLPTSSTVSHIAVWSARAASGDEPGRAASLSGPAGKSAEHQPPLRPEAPKPAVSASSTTTLSDGSASSR